MSQDPSQDNTYVLDTESPVEMARLIDQDRLITAAMGGLLARLPELRAQAKVLDLACGPGGWALDVAFEHPEYEVAGVDISKIMINYAIARARTQKLTNVSFGTMNITEPLDFSDATFDLVNARFLGGVLLRDAWKPFIAECNRILRPGGLLRLTEGAEPMGTTSSAAYEDIMALTNQAFWKAGYGFSVDGRRPGVTTVFPHMLREAGFRDILLHAHALEFSAGCASWQDFYHTMEIGKDIGPAFFEKIGVASSEETTQLYDKVLIDMLLPEFCGIWHLASVIGTKS